MTGTDTRRRARALDADMRRHRWVVLKMSLATVTWIPAARRRLLREIGIPSGATVLDHCTGTGDNLPALSEAVGSGGRIVGVDLAPDALRRARAAAAGLGAPASFLQADAVALPLADRSFDAVVHYGAINQFGEATAAALDELLRVARPGATVVILDEGLAEHRRRGLWGRTLIGANPLFASRPPVDLLRERGIDPEVRWVVRGLFYELRFRAPGGPDAHHA